MERMVSTLPEIHWRLRQIQHGRWEDNIDPTAEQPLTFTANMTLVSLVGSLTPLIEEWCPQDINEFKINDKTNGELSLQWYGEVFELDLDIAADGKISFLLCPTGYSREEWTSVEDATVEQVGEALMKVWNETP